MSLIITRLSLIKKICSTTATNKMLQSEVCLAICFNACRSIVYAVLVICRATLLQPTCKEGDTKSEESTAMETHPHVSF
ncbi:hypothetical protein N665_0091s0039 [Sinapis alba]|nr:hypothetical protein N665_0091s0039 [Sinapis alba]